MSDNAQMTVSRRLHKKLLALIEEISEARRAKGLSQKEVGDGIGMDKGQMSRFLSGKKNITLETVVKFERFLDQEFLVTPTDCEEQLVNDTTRLKEIVDAAIFVKPEFGNELLIHLEAKSNTGLWAKHIHGGRLLETGANAFAVFSIAHVNSNRTLAYMAQVNEPNTVKEVERALARWNETGDYVSMSELASETLFQVSQ